MFKNALYFITDNRRNRMTKMRRSAESAFEELKKRFVFKDYIIGDSGQWMSVGRTVEKYLSIGDKVFDLGSGPCDKTAIAQYMGCKCTAVDDLKDDWHLRKNNIELIEKFASSSGIEFSRDFSPPATNQFSMVMMNDVLEHIHDSPREILNVLVNGLKEGGYLFVTVPNLANIRKRLDLMRGKTNLPPYNLYYWYSGTWRGPQREYVRGDLEAMSSNLGLEIVELRGVHHMLQRLPRLAQGPYKLATAVFPDWRDSWLLVARKPEGWKAKDELSTDEEFGKIFGATSNQSLYNFEQPPLYETGV